MGKVLKPIAVGALFIGAALVTGGASIIPGLKAASFAVAGGTMAFGGTAATIGLAAGLGGTLAGAAILTGAGMILSGVGALFSRTPPVPQATLSRLQPSLVPTAFRKLVVGTTAMATDVRYIEFSGTDDEFVDYIIVHASHRCHAVSEMWFDGRLAWTSAGGVQAPFSGYLTVDVRLEGTASNTIAINGGTSWGAAQRLTGCCYSRLRIKRSGNSKNSRSPLEGGLPGRLTVIGSGLPVYDPRRDSTVGGSGPHRADDQSTWQFVDGQTVLGSNPHLQMLAVLLGWRIGGQRALGAGVAADDIDWQTFATAANISDELITLLDSTTQRRYETGGVFADNQSPREILDVLCAASQSEIDDATGRFSVRVRHNDLADVVMALTDDDIVGGYGYDPSLPLAETPNVVRGRYVNAQALFELDDYAEQRLGSPDGQDRIDTADFGLVQEARRAQRLARGRLQSRQFSGVFTGLFSQRAAAVRKGQIVTLTCSPLGFNTKLFRVLEQSLAPFTGAVELTLGEEDAAIYAGDGTEVAPITVPGPTLFDPGAGPLGYASAVPFAATRNDDGGGNLVAAPFDPEKWTLFGGASQPGTTLADFMSGLVVQLPSNTAGVIWAEGSEVFPVTPGETLFFRHVGTCDSGAPASASVRGGFNFFDRTGALLAGPAGAVTADGADIIQPAALNAVVIAKGQTIVPAGAALARAYSIRVGGAGGNFYVNRPFAGRAQIGADETRGELPAMPRGAWAAGVAYRKGDIANDKNVTWVARAAHTSAANNRPPSSLWESLTAPPNNRSASVPVDFGTGSTSYGGPAATLSVETGPGGSVGLGANLSVVTGLINSGPVRAVTLWQRWTGSAWVDISSEIFSVFVDPDEVLFPLNSYATGASVTGLAPNTSHDFRMLCRRDGGSGSDSLNINGVATGVGT